MLKQARAFQFKVPVRVVERDSPRGLTFSTLLESCAYDLPGLRDRALLSIAYDTGLLASERLAIDVAHILEAIDPDARLLPIPRSKDDQEGEGPTAYLSPPARRAPSRRGRAALVRSALAG